VHLWRKTGIYTRSGVGPIKNPDGIGVPTGSKIKNFYAAATAKAKLQQPQRKKTFIKK
jgi:hypothetical protein